MVDYFKTFSDIYGKNHTMVNHSDIHLGNWVQVEIEGDRFTGKVERTSVERIGVKVKEELGWYYPKDVYPILLTDEWLKHFDFVAQDSSNGELVFQHGPFKLIYPDKNNRKQIILRTHGAHEREFNDGLYVHTLQNHFHGMTKVFIE